MDEKTIGVSQSKLFEEAKIEETENPERFYWVGIQYDDDKNAGAFKPRSFCLQTARRKQKQELSEKFPESSPLSTWWNSIRALCSIYKIYLI